MCGNCRHLLPWIAEAGDDDFAAVAERASIPVLVDLWATWCGPCRTVGAALEPLASERGGEVARLAGGRPGGGVAAPAGRRHRRTETLSEEGAVMNRHDLAWQLPLRLTAGTYVLDSGLHKREPDEETAKHLHGFATGAYPFLDAVEPVTFTKALAAAEMLIGAALVIPVVPARLAGLGLLGFGTGLLGLYARTPGMRRPGTPFPTQEGIALAKDSWLVAIGAALVLGDRR